MVARQDNQPLLKKKKRSKRKGAAKKIESAPMGYGWKVTGFLAAICGITLFSTCLALDWRVSDKMVIHSWSNKQLQSSSYDSSSYGLYMVSFNGGADKTTWSAKSKIICTNVELLAPLSTNIIYAPCNPTCIAHYRTRCSVYRKAASLGTMMLCISIVCALLAILGSVWLFFVSRNHYVLEATWISAGLISLGAFTYWLIQTDEGFKSLATQSKFPYPSLGSAAYASLVASFGLVAAGVAAVALNYLDARHQRLAEQAVVERTLLEKSVNERFKEGLHEAEKETLSPILQSQQRGMLSSWIGKMGAPAPVRPSKVASARPMANQGLPTPPPTSVAAPLGGFPGAQPQIRWPVPLPVIGPPPPSSGLPRAARQPLPGFPTYMQGAAHPPPSY